MKTVFVLFFLVFIGFGFLLSDTLHTRDELVRSQQFHAQLAQQNEELLARLNESERKVQELSQANAAKEETLKRIMEDYTAQKQQIAELQRQVKILTMVTPVQAALPDFRNLLIFLPLIPASIAVTYIISRSNRNVPRSRTNGKNHFKASVQLTDYEVKEIIKKRRCQS
jgi:hypothetical protein